MKNRLLPGAIALSIGFGISACSPDPDPEPSENNSTPVTQPPRPTAKWTSQTIAEDAGLHIRLATDGQNVGVAYFADTSFEDGDCTELGVDPAPVRKRWNLYYAQRDGESWTPEVALDPIYVDQPSGLDLAIHDNTPMIATMTGAPVETIRFCGVNDLGLLTRSGGAWTSETAAATSADAATGDEASDYGEVVGLWPSMAIDSNGDVAIVYKDVHAGGIQSDDRRRADLELAYRQGGWANTPVDWGRGAGDHNQLVFDADDRLTVMYHIPTASQDAGKQGIWARRQAEDGAWDEVQLFNQPSAAGHALMWHPEEQRLVGLYHQSTKGYPALVEQDPEGDFTSLESWTTTDIGDSRYDEGYSASIATSKSGRLAVAYYRCAKSTSTIGDCLPADDALVFKWRDRDEWVTEIVDDGDAEGLCGMSPSMVIDDSGEVTIAYRCETVRDGLLVNTVKIAKRKVLP